MSRWFSFVCRLMLIMGVASCLVFGFAGWLMPAQFSIVVGLLGLVGIFLREAADAFAVAQWRQFSLATILWLMFLLPAAWIVGSSIVPEQRLPTLAVLVVSSYVLKRLVERRAISRPNPEQAHPLDD